MVGVLDWYSPSPQLRHALQETPFATEEKVPAPQPLEVVVWRSNGRKGLMRALVYQASWP
jgi:hypothetical protein